MQISQFLRAADGAIGHYCPACFELHILHVTKPSPSTGAQWEWDGNVIEPTFSPSVEITKANGKKTVFRCHYTLQDGEIKYQEDCTHQLKGVSMKLPALPEFLRDKCLIV